MKTLYIVIIIILVAAVLAVGGYFLYVDVINKSSSSPSPPSAPALPAPAPQPETPPAPQPVPSVDGASMASLASSNLSSATPESKNPTYSESEQEHQFNDTILSESEGTHTQASTIPSSEHSSEEGSSPLSEPSSSPSSPSPSPSSPSPTSEPSLVQTTFLSVPQTNPPSPSTPSSPSAPSSLFTPSSSSTPSLAAMPPITLSKDARCGQPYNEKCLPGQTCSSQGWCGVGSLYVASESSVYNGDTWSESDLTISQANVPVSTNGLCGYQFNSKCPPGQYCSWQGYCGTAPMYVIGGQTAYRGDPAPAPVPAPVPSSLRIIPSTSLYESSNGTCPAGYRYITATEATTNSSALCASLGTWNIDQIGNGGNMNGPGYGCKITPTGTGSYGNALCVLNSTPTPTVVATPTPAVVATPTPAVVATPYPITTNGQCGPMGNPVNSMCPKGTWCSQSWWCGGTGPWQQQGSIPGLSNYPFSNP